MFPDFIGDVEIDVVVSRFANHGPPAPGGYVNEPERRDEVDPIQPGVSVGDGRETGTIGLFVQDRQSNDMCLLGCDHVIASDRYPDHGDPVFQPGKSDGPGRKVAELLRWHRFTGSAVARLAGGISYTNKPFGFDRPICGVREPKRGEILVKSGRTTGITRGLVDGVGDTYDGVGHAFYLVPDGANGGTWNSLGWVTRARYGSFRIPWRPRDYTSKGKRTRIRPTSMRLQPVLPPSSKSYDCASHDLVCDAVRTWLPARPNVAQVRRSGAVPDHLLRGLELPASDPGLRPTLATSTIRSLYSGGCRPRRASCHGTH